MTQFTIQNHRLTDADRVDSPNHGGEITPRFIVQHYTAGYTAESAINTLTKKGSGVSAHVTIDLDGTITQHLPFNIKAWHAGISSHMGHNSLNDCSIGIEIVNIGFLRQQENGKLRDWNSQDKSPSDFPEGLIEVPYPRAGSGNFLWPLYPEVQLQAVEDLTKALINVYEILDVVSHEEIDMDGEKTDPGPAFPMKRMKIHLNNIARGNDTETYTITASTLNVRGGPGTNYAVISQLNEGNTVSVLEYIGQWARINNDGWVHYAYLRRV